MKKHPKAQKREPKGRPSARHHARYKRDEKPFRYRGEPKLKRGASRFSGLEVAGLM